MSQLCTVAKLVRVSPDEISRTSERGRACGRTVAPTAGATLWGTWSLLRPSDAPEFGPEEQEFLARLAPHVARALRRATLTPAALPAGERVNSAADGFSSDAGAAAPAVLTLDASGRMVFQTANAPPVLDDLAARERARGIGVRGTASAATLPGVIGGVLAQLRWRHAHAPHAGLSSTLLGVGGSGRRYALHAVHTEGNSTGAILTVVTITPAQSVDGSAALAMRYGLSAREHAVLLRVARGESTKAIAAALQLSAYTVQDDVGRACERGRRYDPPRIGGEALPRRARRLTSRPCVLLNSARTLTVRALSGGARLKTSSMACRASCPACHALRA